MTDRYKRIRAALAMGPTPGPWDGIQYEDGRWADIYPISNRYATPIVYVPPCSVLDENGIWKKSKDETIANAKHVAACDPDTIRALLEERDALQAENERLHEQLRLALRDAAPAVQGEPVAYIRQEDFEFIMADDKSEPYGTRQAPVFSRKDCRAPVPLYAAPQPPAQDVSALVEAALELARRTLAMAAIEGEVTRRIDSALAAHRKQGDEQ